MNDLNFGIFNTLWTDHPNHFEDKSSIALNWRNKIEALIRDGKV